MLLPQHRYLKPESLEDCLAELGEAGETGQIVAGGADVTLRLEASGFALPPLLGIVRVPASSLQADVAAQRSHVADMLGCHRGYGIGQSRKSFLD